MSLWVCLNLKLKVDGLRPLGVLLIQYCTVSFLSIHEFIMQKWRGGGGEMEVWTCFAFQYTCSVFDIHMTTAERLYIAWPRPIEISFCLFHSIVVILSPVVGLLKDNKLKAKPFAFYIRCFDNKPRLNNRYSANCLLQK